MKFSYFLLLSLYQLHRSVRIVNHLKKLLTNTLFHSCYKFSTLNIFPYRCFTVKSSWNINFHSIRNLLDFFNPMIINICLHLMNRITWINSRNSCLIFGIFKYQTYHRINVSYYDIGFVVEMLRRVKWMVYYHVSRWHVCWGCLFGLGHWAFVQFCSLVIFEISILNVYFSLFSSYSSLFFLKAILILFHLRFNILLIDLFFIRTNK